MNEKQLKYYLSNPRFNTYLSKTNNEFEKAYNLYKLNIELSEAFYPILSILEISLRNVINESLKSRFNDVAWFKNCLPTEFSPLVDDAIRKVTLRKTSLTPDRIIAELNFGFWSRLFNRNYSELLWKELRLIFKNAPKHLRQRDTISKHLHRIRTMRNRIYHYEPIFDNLQELENQYIDMLAFISWIDEDLLRLLADIDRFQSILAKAKSA